MRRYATLHIRPARRSLRLVAALGLVTALLLPAAAAPAAAAEEGTMTARALVGGHVGVGAWSAVEVDLANDGPAISGELRLGGGQPGASTYGALVDLPTNSKKRYLLYAQPSIFGRDILIDLIAGGQRLATTKVPITAHDVYQPIVVVVAEQPGRLIPDLTAAVSNPNMPVAAIVSLSPADLPGRIEAWSAIDRLVWQDVDSSKLDDAQLDALRAWLGLGGRLVILGGSTGATTLGGFPDAILPFRPTRTVDATPDDLGPLLGAVPALGERLPVLGGTLIEGSVLARSGDDIIAAERSVGQGDVLIVGMDPGQSGIAGSAGARSLWRRAVPMAPGAVVNPLALPDDRAIVAALNYLPAVGLPPVEQLLVLLVAYIVLIGPVNYLILRRLDRREWAWLTMPLLIVVFSAGAFGLGRLLKGSDTVVNEIAIVRGAAGAGSGLGQVYVGVFPPTRRTFDVKVAGGALLSNPISLQQQGAFGQPLDILLGDPARLRGYEVNFGVLRGFRAETALPTPKIEAKLELATDRVRGTVTKDSDEKIEAAAVVFGGSLVRLGDLAPGQTVSVDLALGASNVFGLPLSERLFGSQSGGGGGRTQSRHRTPRPARCRPPACPSTASPPSSSSTARPGSGWSSSTWARAPRSRWPSRSATSTRPADSSSGSSTAASRARAASTSHSRSSWRAPSREPCRAHRGPREALRRHAGRGRRGPRGGRRRDPRPRRTQRGGQDHDAEDAGHPAPADRGPGRGGRRRRGPGTGRRAPRHRLHARQLRGLRRHEGLGVPRLLRPLLWPAAGATAPDDRRPT